MLAIVILEKVRLLSYEQFVRTKALATSAIGLLLPGDLANPRSRSGRFSVTQPRMSLERSSACNAFRRIARALSVAAH